MKLGRFLFNTPIWPVAALCAGTAATAATVDSNGLFGNARALIFSSEVFEYSGDYAIPMSLKIIVPEESPQEGVADETDPVEETEQTPVSFTSPLTTGGPEIEGQSLQQLIEGSPLFTPIEGIPEELWKDKQCSSCHNWTQEDLCVQGNTYVDDKSPDAMVKQHPYGGGFKRNLKAWAASACQ